MKTLLRFVLCLSSAATIGAQTNIVRASPADDARRASERQSQQQSDQRQAAAREQQRLSDQRQARVREDNRLSEQRKGTALDQQRESERQKSQQRVNELSNAPSFSSVQGYTRSISLEREFLYPSVWIGGDNMGFFRFKADNTWDYAWPQNGQVQVLRGTFSAVGDSVFLEGAVRNQLSFTDEITRQDDGTRTHWLKLMSPYIKSGSLSYWRLVCAAVPGGRDCQQFIPANLLAAMNR